MVTENKAKFQIGDYVKVEINGETQYGIVYESHKAMFSDDYFYRVETVLGKVKDVIETALKPSDKAEVEKAWKATYAERVKQLTSEKIIAREKAEHPEWFGEKPVGGGEVEGSEGEDEDE